MKTSNIIIFSADLLLALYKSYTYVTEKKVVDLEELEIKKDNQRTANWRPYIGIGMVVIGGALLMLGRKKSLTA